MNTNVTSNSDIVHLHSSPASLNSPCLTLLRFACPFPLHHTRTFLTNTSQFAAKLHNWRHGVSKHASSLTPTASPLRAGVLSAAAINFTTFFDPVSTHPDITISAIAARSAPKAQAQITKYSLGANVKAYGSYEELLADKDIDVIYTALPNGLHARWVIAALEAGKHVLVEKPVAATAADVRLIKEAAERAGKAVLEAMHWRFHPAAHAVHDVIASGDYGKVKSFKANMVLPGGALAADDIRFNYALAGGASMDLCYVMSAANFICGSKDAKVTVTSAKPRISKFDKNIDEAMDTTLEFASADGEDGVIKAATHGDLNPSKLLGVLPRYWDAVPSFTIELDRATLHLDNFVGPHMNHSISIQPKEGKKKTVSAYQGGSAWGDRGQRWWTSYRYQLEAFVDAVRAKDAGGNPPPCWVSLDESLAVMELVDAVYDKAGLPRRSSTGLKEQEAVKE